jgi:transcriptional regulator with XRE-family HTH domain
MATYSDTLAAHLKARKLTDREFGDLIGATQPTVWRYRNGARFPDASVAREIDRRTEGAVPFALWLAEFNAKAGIAA